MEEKRATRNEVRVRCVLLGGKCVLLGKKGGVCAGNAIGQ